MPLTGQELADKVGALYGDGATADQTLAILLQTNRTLHGTMTDGGTAGTAQTETPYWRNNTGITVRVVSAHVIAPVAVTADAANNATFNVFRRTSAGASQTTIATGTTSVAGLGSLVAQAPMALNLTAANVLIPVGGVLTVSMTKAGVGVAVAAATSQLAVEVVVQPVG